MMKKISLGKLLLLTLLSLNVTPSFAQNAATAVTPAVPPAAAAAEPAKNIVPQDPNKTNTDKQADAAAANTKPLENSTLVDNIQGGMAGLLMSGKSVSLMFDDKENENIERALDSFKNNQAFVPDGDSLLDPSKPKDLNKKDLELAQKAKKDEDDFNSKSYIYLASIMYLTARDWVVWINDKKITSEDNKKGKELFLKSVNKDQVSILWNVSPSKLRVLLGNKVDSLNLTPNESGQIEVKFSLQPNQTFLLGSNKIIEGKVAASLAKKIDDLTAPAKTTESTATTDTTISKYKTRVNQN